MALTLTELLALLPDNNTGEIDAADLRTITTELFDGTVGPQGPPGVDGVDGTNGVDGAPGPTGGVGATGATGPQGIPGPQGVQGPVGPTGPRATWTFTVVSADYTAAPWEYVHTSSGITITLPAAPAIGDKVAVCRDGIGITLTVQGSPGQTINGQTVVKMVAGPGVAGAGAPAPVLVFVYVQSNVWRVESTTVSDGALGFEAGGMLGALGGFTAVVLDVSAATTIHAGLVAINCTTPGASYALTFGTNLWKGQVFWIYNGGTVPITLAASGSGSVVGGSVVNPGQTVHALVIVRGNNPVVAITGNQVPVNVQVFTANGTWTKPPGCTTVRVMLFGSGGGGGAGRRGAAGSLRTGGGGGGAGGFTDRTVPASLLGATESVGVGVGGNGAAAQAVDSTDGAAGPGGSSSVFGPSGGSTYGTRVNGGGGGGGGTSAGAATAGSGGGGSVSTGGAGGQSSATGGVGGVGSSGNPSGGGSGGGITTGDVAANGGNSGASVMHNTPGGVGGVVDTTAATSPPAGTTTNALAGWFGGMGGGGGAASKTAAAQVGAAAGAVGGGGGGGGASLNGFASGGGGRGGDGLVVVIST